MRLPSLGPSLTHLRASSECVGWYILRRSGGWSIRCVVSTCEYLEHTWSKGIPLADHADQLSTPSLESVGYGRLVLARLLSSRLGLSVWSFVSLHVSLFECLQGFRLCVSADSGPIEVWSAEGSSNWCSGCLMELWS